MNNLLEDHALEYAFVWKIKNFSISTFHNRKKYIASPVIKPKTFDDTRWFVYIMLEEPADKDSMGFYLQRCQNDEGPASIMVGFEFSVVDKYGKQRKNQLSTNSDFLRGTSKGFGDFLLRKDVLCENSNFLLNDTLTLKGRIWKYSYWSAPLEKVLIRSTLKGENSYFTWKIRPWQLCATKSIHFNSVQGDFHLTCKWDSWKISFPSELRFPRITIAPPDGVTGKLFMSAQIWIIDKRQEPSFRTKDSHCFEEGSNIPWCLPTFQGKPDQYGFIDIEELNLVCEFAVSRGEQEDIFDTTYESLHQLCVRNPCEPPPPNIQTAQMKAVLDDVIFSDMCVRVGRVTIPAHRIVLSARSPLFHKLLFESSLNWQLAVMHKKAGSLAIHESSGPNVSRAPKEQERLDKAIEKCGLTISKMGKLFVIDFSNVDPNNLRRMMSFMYTDAIDDVDFDTAMQLLSDSDRYLIDGLKEWCETFLITRITKDNVFNVMNIAKKLDCNVLTLASQLFAYEYN